jgi:hypothetical protein
LSKNAISSIEGNFRFCPVESRILLSLIFDDTVEILFVIVIRFFFAIPGDFDDGIDRLCKFIADVVVVAAAAAVRFGDNGWEISSLIFEDRTVNDEEVGIDDDTVLLIIKRGGGFETTGCIGGVEVPDEDNKISVIEFIRSYDIRKGEVFVNELN